MTVTWTSPASGLLTTELELDQGSPVYEATFSANNGSNGPVYYTLETGELPEHYKLVQTGTATGYLRIEPLVRELDEYVDSYARPADFTYDTEDTAGGNYATYGSALHGGYTFNFTIRAYNASGLTTFTDSNGDLQYILDSNFLINDFADRTFSIVIQNNWSSDRDAFILEYYENTTIRYDGVEYTPENYLIEVKDDGYFT